MLTNEERLARNRKRARIRNDRKRTLIEKRIREVKELENVNGSLREKNLSLIRKLASHGVVWQQVMSQVGMLDPRMDIPYTALSSARPIISHQHAALAWQIDHYQPSQSSIGIPIWPVPHGRISNAGYLQQMRRSSSTEQQETKTLQKDASKDSRLHDLTQRQFSFTSSNMGKEQNDPPICHEASKVVIDQAKEVQQTAAPPDLRHIPAKGVDQNAKVDKSSRLSSTTDDTMDDSPPVPVKVEAV